MAGMKNKSIVDGDEYDVCYLCGGRAVHTHHIFEGTGCRKPCDKRRLTVRLCVSCHNKLHDTSCPEMAYLHRVGQRTYEGQL